MRVRYKMIRTNVLRPCIKSSMDTLRELGHETSMRGRLAAQHARVGRSSSAIRTGRALRHRCRVTTGSCSAKQVYCNFFMDLCYSSFTEQGVSCGVLQLIEKGHTG